MHFGGKGGYFVQTFNNDSDDQTSRPVLRVESLSKSFGREPETTHVLGDVSFEVDAGQFVCVVGPSGSGKTTLLRALGGLASPSGGRVVLEDQEVTAPPAKMALVFQDYSNSLLPWTSVMNNVILPMRNKFSAPDREQRATDALVAVGLRGKEDLYPWQMSGGMQQRVAIARALAYQPDVLLMDEPFAAVDAQTRIELEDLVLSLQRQFDMTMLFVTHDIDEAIYLGDRVIVLSGAPTTVTEDVVVDLPRERDQIETKSLPRYVELRRHVFGLIQSAQLHASIGGDR